ncbi:MAG: hypothetical protein M3N68_14180, partial [Actinomycetota bacterium]|nr:hypothetical protein [Actinomycetota bacterium]
MVAAEGAAVVVLEPAEQARARGAGVLALVSGGGSAGDAHNLAAPHPQGRGAELAMRRALADAAVQPSAVDALVAHATATPLGDVAEVRAVKAVFGASPRLAVTAPKGAIGHGLGAAGAFAVVVAALSLRDGVLAPTRNLSDPDPECQLDHVVDRPRRAALGKVLVNASGFGGQNAAVLLSRDQP